MKVSNLPSTAEVIIQPKEQFNFISILRAVAALLVVWDHLAGFGTDQNKVNWEPLNLMRSYINTPLGIIQDFGFLGVVLFFVISGFIITHVAQRESRLEFAIKRVFRIYPPFILSIIIIVLAEYSYSFRTFA